MLTMQFGQNLYIAMSRGHGETEDDMMKKMQVFYSILSFLVGPVKRRFTTHTHTHTHTQHGSMKKCIEWWSVAGFDRKRKYRELWSDFC